MENKGSVRLVKIGTLAEYIARPFNTNKKI